MVANNQKISSSKLPANCNNLSVFRKQTNAVNTLESAHEKSRLSIYSWVHLPLNNHWWIQQDTTPLCRQGFCCLFIVIRPTQAEHASCDASGCNGCVPSPQIDRDPAGLCSEHHRTDRKGRCMHHPSRRRKLAHLLGAWMMITIKNQ